MADTLKSLLIEARDELKGWDLEMEGSGLQDNSDLIERIDKLLKSEVLMGKYLKNLRHSGGFKRHMQQQMVRYMEIHNAL